MRGKRSDFILYKLCCISQIHSSRKLEFNQWEMAIFDPHRNHTPWPITKKWYRWLRRRPLRLWQIWWKSVHGGLLCKWVKYNEIFSYLFIPFFMNSPTGQTRRRIFTLDGSNDADSRKDVPFGGFVDIAPNFGGEIPPPENPNFWGVNRRFQAKRAKYWKFYVIETTASRSRRDIQAMWWWVISPF